MEGPTENLTAKQRRVLEFLQRRYRSSRGAGGAGGSAPSRGAAPTYREIAAHLGVDVRAAYQHVVALERKGVLSRTGARGRMRRIELAPEYRPPAGIPLVGRVAAGTPILAEENVEEHVDLARELSAKLGDGSGDELFLLRVRGESMTGAGINDGDFVLVRRQETVADGEIAAVVIRGEFEDEATVKRVRIIYDRAATRARCGTTSGAGSNASRLPPSPPRRPAEEGWEPAGPAEGRGVRRIRLEPANPDYTPIVLHPGDEVRIAGKVLMAIRRF